MATQTSTGNKNWSDPTAWTTAVPLDGDTVIVRGTDTITFDVNQSAFTIGVSLTINSGGILQCSTAAGTYYLKIKSPFVIGPGSVNAGSAGTPLPSNVTFTIDFSTSTSQNTATFNLYCTQPTIVSLVTTPTVSDASAQAVLTVATNVTGDPLWVNGATVGTANASANGAAVAYTEFLISAVSATTITLQTNLAAAMLKNSRVALLSRNIKLVSSAITSTPFYFNNASVINAECIVPVGASGVTALSCSNFDGTLHQATGSHRGITGSSPICGVHSVIGGGQYGLIGSTNHTFRGLMMGMSTAGINVTGIFLDGIISGCASGIISSTGLLSGPNMLVENCGTGIIVSDADLSGSIQNCVTGILGASGTVLRGMQLGTILPNTFDIRNDGSAHEITGYGANLGSTTQMSTTYSAGVAAVADPNRVLIWDHAGVAGNVRAWMAAGLINTSLTVFPVGQLQSYNGQFNALNPTVPLYLDIPFRIEAGQVLNIGVWLRKDIAIGTMLELASAQIIDPTVQNFSAGSVLQTWTMTDNLNTFSNGVLSVTSTYGRFLALRFRGRHSSGNMFFAYQFLPAFGSQQRARRVTRGR